MDNKSTKAYREWFDKHRDVMVAFECGGKVEVKNANSGAWTPADSPMWSINSEYRVKPTPTL